MQKVLLIDDEAEKGWKEILERVLFSGGLIESCSTIEEAISALERTKYDLIFLDLRFGHGDHSEIDVKKFGGFKILVSHIRASFETLNFSTPVMLFTASNKIWNIFEVLEHGADSYYIKEHPDYSSDLEFSRENFIRLKRNIPYLIGIGEKRQIVLEKVREIIHLSTSAISIENIRTRITEKLKIAYSTIFHKNSSFEDGKFLFNKELLGFISIWSILEEVVKDSFLDNWIKSGKEEGMMSGGNWLLRNGKSFVEHQTLMNGEQPESALLEVKLIYNAGLYEEGARQIRIEDKDFVHFSGKINLSLQVYAVMILGKGWSGIKAKSLFEELNKFRNRVDFIHSSIDSIFNKTLTNQKDKDNAMVKCNLMLDFLIKLLS